MPPLPTHEELELFAAEMVRNGQLSWLGFRQDTGGLYTIPVVSPASAKLTLAYAKAYAAPLLARVAELEKDAARYRWLFSDGPTHTPIAGTPSMSQSRGPYVMLDPPSANSFSGMVLGKSSADHFIDAALAAHKEKP